MVNVRLSVEQARSIGDEYLAEVNRFAGRRQTIPRTRSGDVAVVLGVNADVADPEHDRGRD